MIMDETKITTAIEKARKGICQYLEIMRQLPLVDVSRDRAFQRKYNAFYRVRQRPRVWYIEYYTYLESNKRGKPKFDTVLDHLFLTLGKYEPSFSSKLVATLNPHEPIWDRFVIKNIGEVEPLYTDKNRVAKAKIVYKRIQDWYSKYIVSPEGKLAITTFNRLVAEHESITDVKKVDFILWQTRS